MLKNKNIVLGVSGGIAAYKAADLASRLVRAGANVNVIMTKSAQEFISPVTFRSITSNPVATDTFEEPKHWEIAHISLAQKADAFVIAPATANVIGKVASGIADDMLSTTVMATKAPVIIAPAMNTNMYENRIVQDNIEKLKKYGYIFVEPESGRLACGTEGKGRLADNTVTIEAIEAALTPKDMTGRRVLVTAGPTKEYMDPVRFISNPSSGKMGYAVAKNAKNRGAEVILVSGEVNITPPTGVELIKVVSATDMYDAVKKYAPDCDVIVKAAAVGDFRPAKFAEHKLKKDEIPVIELVKNPDILESVCKDRKKGVVVGFCMETRDLAEQAYAKLIKKGADLIVANNVAEENAGFAYDTNTACIINKEGTCEQLENMPKQELAKIILDRAIDLL